jgi:hypothetical protein
MNKFSFEISIFSFLGSLIYLPGPQVLDLMRFGFDPKELLKAIPE